MVKQKKWCIFALCLVAILSGAFVLLKSDAFAACNASGYCYGTGQGPSGGLCGNPSNNGTWWDTCYGLSWQYYDWPEGYTGNINFPGSTNSGHATVSGQCAEYGGFWFLGYEVYQPSTGNSYGYQAGSPKAGMLEARGGYTRLYSMGNPSPNPSILINANGESFYLRGSRYADEETMDNEIYNLFRSYAEGGNLVSGSGQNAGGSTFNDLNWFCAREPMKEAPQKKFAGMVEVVAGNKRNTAGWNNPAEATVNITLNEGETVNIRFDDYMKSDGTNAWMQYTISGDFVGVQPEEDYFSGADGTETTELVGSHQQTVSTSGKYCERLMFEDNAIIRLMQACANVTVEPTPPDIFGRIKVEAVVYDKNGDVKTTLTPLETAWNDTVDLRFTDSMKGEGNTPISVEYVTSNSAFINKEVGGSFDYAGSSASGAIVTVKETQVDGANHRGEVICETLRFGKNPEQSVVACAEILRDDEPDLTRSLSGGDSFGFAVDVDLKLSVSLSNRLITDTGTNGTFLRDSTTLDVSTNSINGFVATLTTDKNAANEHATDLRHDYKDSTIQTLSSSVTRANFPVDKWGYSVDDTDTGDDTSTYSPLVPMDSSSPIIALSSNGPSSQSQEIYFGTKMGVLQPAGTYSNSIVFRVVTRVVPETPTTINDIEYMQDINDDVIASMVKNQQYQLKDKRDEKAYWIAKIDDGRVLMTQSLDLELRYGDILTNELTDIGYGSIYGEFKSGRTYWVVDNYTRHSMLGRENSWAFRYGPQAELASWSDCSMYYGCGGMSYRPASDPSVDDYLLAGERTEEHPDGIYRSNFLNDADCAASTDYTEEECTHYRVGVLYNAISASAGGVYSEIYQFGYTDSWGDRSSFYLNYDSICPKGWRLFDEQYDFQHGLYDNGYGNYADQYDNWKTYLDGIYSRMISAPLYFAPANQTIYYEDYLYYPSHGEDRATFMFWSSKDYLSDPGLIDYDGQMWGGDYYNFLGAQVRCVARFGNQDL